MTRKLSAGHHRAAIFTALALAVTLAAAVAAQPTPAAAAMTDDQLVGLISGQLNDYWRARWASTGNYSYVPPKAAWFSEAQFLKVACYSGQMFGPFYCRLDDTVYLDREFIRRQRLRLATGRWW